MKTELASLCLVAKRLIVNPSIDRMERKPFVMDARHIPQDAVQPPPD